MRELGIVAVPHGFRSSLRDWTAECSDAPREVCELALAHVSSALCHNTLWHSAILSLSGTP